MILFSKVHTLPGFRFSPLCLATSIFVWSTLLTVSFVTCMSASIVFMASEYHSNVATLKSREENVVLQKSEESAVESEERFDLDLDLAEINLVAGVQGLDLCSLKK